MPESVQELLCIRQPIKVINGLPYMHCGKTHEEHMKIRAGMLGVNGAKVGLLLYWRTKNVIRPGLFKG